MSFTSILPKDLLTLVYNYEPQALYTIVMEEWKGKKITIYHLEEAVKEASKEDSSERTFHSKLMLKMLVVDRLFSRLGSSLPENSEKEFRLLAVDCPLEKIDFADHVKNSTPIKWQLFIQLIYVEPKKLEDIVSTHSAKFNPLETEFVESAQSVRRVGQILFKIESNKGWQQKDLESNNELVSELPKLAERNVELVAFGVINCLRIYLPYKRKNFLDFMFKASDSPNFKGNLLQQAAKYFPDLFKI